MFRKWIILLVFIPAFLLAQDNNELDQNTGFFNKKNISLIGLSGFYAYSLYHSYNMWWKGNSKSFNFFDQWGWFDEPGSIGLDRAGHFYTSYFFYHTQKNLLLWGGHSRNFSMWFSALLTGGFAVLIEIGDGYSTYGFDHRDLVFNIGGLAYGMLQDYFPFLNNFNFKWSFFPSDFKFPPRFTEHYDGHIYWLTADIHNLFKESLGKYWPKFLQPAIGFSLADNGETREFVFGLDWNLNFLFDNSNENLSFLGKTLNLFHVPAPGVKYTSKRQPDYRLLLIN